MAKNIHWSVVWGSDAADGLTKATAKRTLGGVMAIAETWDRIVIWGGVYPISILGSAQFLAVPVVFKPATYDEVIFDFELDVIAGDAHLWTQAPCVFVKIKFRNPSPGKFCVSTFSGAVPTLLDCVFYQRDGAPQTGHAARKVTMERCSWWNLASPAFYGQDFGTPVGSVKSCYAVDCAAPAVQAGSTADYNAYPGNTEPNGIDTDDANSDPGFVDALAEDFRIAGTDPVAQALIRTSGHDHGPIGSTGTPGPVSDARWEPLRWINPTPAHGEGCDGAWEDDTSYEDPAGAAYTGAIIEDPVTFEPVLDLVGNPDAKSGRLLGPARDRGVADASWDTVFLSRFEDGPGGALLDRDLALPGEFEVLHSDDAGFSGASWVPVESGDMIEAPERYARERITFQREHPNE